MTERIGRYQLIQRIGQGGMGDVFLAVQTGPKGFERRCVLKMLREDIAREDPESRKMFLTEARVCSQLMHPNLVTVYDFGEAGGTYYLVMEYVIGPTLRELLRSLVVDGQQMPAALAARVVAELARGLGSAQHTRLPDGRPLHLVHRDVSPSNIVISTEGVTKLIDFGVARASVAAHRTSKGLTRGKVSYMSPEQLQGLPLDARSDLYSLGLVLYEMLAGAPAVTAEYPDDMLSQAVEMNFTPLSDIRRDAPELLVECVAQLLQPHREQRFPSGDALARTLDTYLATVGSEGSRPALASFVTRSSAWWPELGPRPVPVLDGQEAPTMPSREHLSGAATAIKAGSS